MLILKKLTPLFPVGPCPIFSLRKKKVLAVAIAAVAMSVSALLFLLIAHNTKLLLTDSVDDIPLYYFREQPTYVRPGNNGRPRVNGIVRHLIFLQLLSGTFFSVPCKECTISQKAASLTFAVVSPKH